MASVEQRPVAVSSVLFNPHSYDGAEFDEATRRALRATIDFFESRGKATLNCPAEEAYQTAVAVLKVNDAIEAKAPVAFTPADFKV